MALAYVQGEVAAFAHKYETGSRNSLAVAGGRRLAVSYIYAEDGITPACAYCGGEVESIYESFVIDIGPAEQTLIDALGDRLRAREFDLAPNTVYLCTVCGHWVSEQHVIGEDLRYVLQQVGQLAQYSDPSKIPLSEMARQLALRRVRLRDLDPTTVEKLIGEFLRAEWAPCQVTHVGRRGGGDLGVDLVLIREEKEYLVQVKHHPRWLQLRPSEREGVDPIRALNGVLFREGKARGIFVTTAKGYTRGAQNEIKIAEGVPHEYEFFALDRFDVNRWISHTPGAAPWRTKMRPGPWPESVYLMRGYENVVHEDLDYG